MASALPHLIVMSAYILVTQMTKGTVGSMDSGPLNRVVYEGATNTTFTCKGNFAYMDWMVFPFTYTGPHNSESLTTNGQLKPSYNKLFAIDLSQGREVYTLVLFNATIFPTDGAPFPTAGLYYCLTEDDDLNQLSNDFYAHLVVIRSDPICSSNFTQSTSMLQSGDAIQLSCTIVYGAFRQWPIDAVMTWSVNGQPVSAADATFRINSSPTEITASSTLVIHENFDATYECGTTFSQPPYAGPLFANNAPDYFKTCTIKNDKFTKPKYCL